MGNNRCRAITRLVLASTAVAACWGYTAASAETYETPETYPTLPWNLDACVGTDGSSCNSYIAITQGGGCAEAMLAISIGDRGGGCGSTGSEATGNIGIGLFGADASGILAFSDTGDATGVTSDGSAVSGTGCARAQLVAVSGTGCAEAGPSGTGLGLGDERLPRVAVSGAGSAQNWDGNGVTLAPLGGGNGGAVVVAGNNATTSGGLVAISLTGEACGASIFSLSLLGRAC